jgi:hypothetical protein
MKRCGPAPPRASAPASCLDAQSLGEREVAGLTRRASDCIADRVCLRLAGEQRREHSQSAHAEGSGSAGTANPQLFFSSIFLRLG